jgi:hypothetical protein
MNDNRSRRRRVLGHHIAGKSRTSFSCRNCSNGLSNGSNVVIDSSCTPATPLVAP